MLSSITFRWLLLTWMTVCRAQHTDWNGTVTYSLQKHWIFTDHCYSTEKEEECSREWDLFMLIFMSVIIFLFVILPLLLCVVGNYLANQDRKKAFHLALQEARETVLLVPEEESPASPPPTNGAYQASFYRVVDGETTQKLVHQTSNLRFEPHDSSLWKIHGIDSQGVQITEGCWNARTGYAYWLKRDWLSKGYFFLPESTDREWHLEEQGAQGSYVSFVRL